MEKENLKITSYENGVSGLPDYPSDEGYTAEMLKAVFDARSDKEIKEKHNELCDATAEIFEALKAHCEDKENPHRVREEQIEGERRREIKVVSNQAALSEIIPEKDEIYLIKYENLRYKDDDGNVKISEKTVYVMKTGDGETALSELPPMQNIVPSEGEGSLSQFVESEASGYMTGGIFYLPASRAVGHAAVALGRYNNAIGVNSMAVNYNNKVKARDAFAANSGNSIEENAEGAFAAGHGNKVKGLYQAVFGTYANVGENDAFVVGNGTSDAERGNVFKVDKQGYVDLKNLRVENSVSTKSVVAQEKSYIGNGVITEKEANFAQNIVEGAGAAAFGGSNKIYGRNGFALMTSNTIPANCESVFIAGHANTAAASHQAIFGTYAAPETSDAFVIGNGTSAGKKNAFAVDRKGNIRIGGTQLTLANTVITEEEAKTLKTPRETVIKSTNQEYKLTSYTNEEKKLPISTGAFEQAIIACISCEDMLARKIAELEKRLSGESE